MQHVDQTPLVSVICTTRNRPDLVKRMVASARAQDYPAMEIVVVDDGSEPAVPDLGVAVQIRHPTGHGACESRNEAVARARGEFLLVLDDDACLLDADTVRRALEVARAHPHAGVVAFAEVRHDGTGGYRLHEYQAASSSVACYAPWFCAAGSLLRKDALVQVGGFEPRFGYYYEEVELGLRLWDAGWQILYVPELRVLHTPDARGRDTERIEALLLRNALYTIATRYPWWYAPAAAGVHVMRYARRHSGARARRVLGEVLGQLRPLLRDREPVRFRTLRKVRRLGRWPERLSADVEADR